MNIPKSRFYRIIPLLFLVYTVAYADRTNIGMAAPYMVKNLNLSSTITGVLLSAFFWGYVITQIPGGWVSQKFSAKKVIISAMVIWGIASVLTGVVTTYNSLLITRFVMGLAEGVLLPTAGVFLANWFPEHERARGTTLFQMSSPFAVIIMAPTAGWLIQRWNYHVMFVVQALPAFIMAILVSWLAAESPAKDRFISTAERNYIEGNIATTVIQKGSLKDVLFSRKIWMFSIVYFLWINGNMAFVLWLPTIMKSLNSLFTPETIGLLTALPYILSIVTMVIIAFVSDRYVNRRSIAVGIPLFIGGVALLVVPLIKNNVSLSIIALMIVGIGVMAPFGAWWAWVLRYMPQNQTGVGLGLINLCGNLGAITGPILIGVFSHGGNVTRGFSILGCAMLLSTVLAVFVAGRFKLYAMTEKQELGA